MRQLTAAAYGHTNVILPRELGFGHRLNLRLNQLPREVAISRDSILANWIFRKFRTCFGTVQPKLNKTQSKALGLIDGRWC